MTLQRLIQEYTELHKPVRDFELGGYSKELSKYGDVVYVRGLRARDLNGRKITSVAFIEQPLVRKMVEDLE